jgi:hypothetical protein
MNHKLIYGAVAAAAVLAAGASATAAQASVTAYHQSYQKDGSYSFASNTDGSFEITSAPQSHSDSRQSLGADGVSLSTSPGSGDGGYADSGVIVNLGPLDSLFSHSGSYQAPRIEGSANLGVNFYFDTSNGAPYALSGDTYTGAGGNNYASMGSPGGTLDSADFGTFCSEAGTDTAFTQLGCNTLTMSEVRADYAAENGSENVRTADPDVYAWIGVSGSAAENGYVTSVDGQNLVTRHNSPPPVRRGRGDVVTLTYLCGTIAGSGYTIDATVSGPYTAKVNFISQDGGNGKSAWLGSYYISPGQTKPISAALGYWGVGAYWDRNGSQPARYEVGAEYTYEGAPGPSERVACSS